jgi:serine phosphatase RsbU (regulator of sigma subunit)
MTRDPRTITPGSSWEDAMALLERFHVRHLPVVEKGQLVGVLTARDLMARRADYLNRLVEERTRELRQANERLQERDAETRLHMMVAGRLQMRLLPGQAPRLPEIECYAHYAPLDPLGGDHYDFAQPDPRHLGILIADASGHSIPAAMVAIMARTAFATASREGLSPAAVLSTMNQNLHGLTGEHFVTAFYGIFDRQSRLLTYANAGQPFPYCYHATPGKCEPLVAHGLMLGILPDSQYDEHHLQLSAGDKLLFYTDGVVDCVGEQDQAFGVGRLEAHLQEHGKQSARSLAQTLAHALTAFRGSRPPLDDLTILAAEIR